MSGKKSEDPAFVTEELCHARHETVGAYIDGLKKTIYVSSAAVGFTVVLFEFILRVVMR